MKQRLIFILSYETAHQFQKIVEKLRQVGRIKSIFERLIQQDYGPAGCRKGFVKAMLFYSLLPMKLSKENYTLEISLPSNLKIRLEGCKTTINDQFQSYPQKDT